jgi:hypothetical protein
LALAARRRRATDSVNDIGLLKRVKCTIFLQRVFSLMR